MPYVGPLASAVSTIWSLIDGSYSTNNAKDVYECISDFVQEAIDTSLIQYDWQMTDVALKSIKGDYDRFFELLELATANGTKQPTAADKTALQAIFDPMGGEVIFYHILLGAIPSHMHY